MSTPPFYEDLGKASRDVFNKGYDYPKIKLSLKTTTESGVQFETNGSHDLDKSRTTGCLKTKLKFPEQGLTFTESWNTSSELNAELKYTPDAVKGLELSLNSNWTPSSGQKSAKFCTKYSREYFSIDADADIQTTGPMFRGSAVFLYKGWYAGYELGYSTNKSQFTANNASVGYTGEDFTCHSSLKDLSDCLASVHHKLSDRTEIGLQTTYNVQTGNPSLGVATKYTMCDGAVLRAKVNHNGQIGMGYTQDLRKGVKIGFSSLVEARNINGGGHKLGLSLDFES